MISPKVLKIISKLEASHIMYLKNSLNMFQTEQLRKKFERKRFYIYRNQTNPFIFCIDCHIRRKQINFPTSRIGFSVQIMRDDDGKPLFILYNRLHFMLMHRPDRDPNYIAGSTIQQEQPVQSEKNQVQSEQKQQPFLYQEIKNPQSKLEEAQGHEDKENDDKSSNQ
eukprot:403332671